MPKVERTTTRVTGFETPELDFQLMRSLGVANYGGGAAGEIFFGRSTITGEDPAEWPPAFEAVADQVERAGEDAARANHAVTARDHFLRASMYWRSAEYFSDPFGSELRERGLASKRSFVRAMELLDENFTELEIPFEDMMLPGYLLTPKGSKGAGPTVLVLTGFDGTAEEIYFQTARAGLDRGFNVLLAEGPGQTGTRRRYPESVFRPDYERPISAMIDVALTRPEVDPQRLALYGISFGGYFTTRAAEHDERIKALVVNSPIVDLREYMLGFVDDDVADEIELMVADTDEVPDALLPCVQKLMFKAACCRFGVASDVQWKERLKVFTAVDNLAQIQCPTLAMIGTGEGPEANRQFDLFAESIRGPITRRMFTVEEGAEMHCQLGNLPLSNAVVYDWLSETL